MEAVSAALQDDSSGANPSSVKSDDSSPRHDSGRGSPPPNCAICLGTCKNKSFTDSCLHQFCFKCLLTWSKVKAECPLCKQNFRSIIHNVRSNHQYEEYMVEQRQTEETTERIDIDNLTAAPRRFRYRTTLTLPRRETIAIQQLLLHYHPIMAEAFPPPATRVPPARRRRSPTAFRRTVYRHNLWARPLPDFTGRYRDCSPEFYRYNDSQMHRLVPWLNRELHYLLNENIGHISYVMARILELLPQYHLSSPEFRDALQRYFGDRTEHFLHELFCFASTPYDMTGYDRNVQYTTDTRISTMVNEVISSSESEASVDSDIVMISSSEPAEPPPGPSRLPAPVYPQNYIPQPPADNVIPIETISQSDTDDDSSEVMLVGYIKPPQDRTPEVVDLLGSDSDVIVQDSTQPEPAQSTEVPEYRPTPLVKLSLKRQRTVNNDDSDSDNSVNNEYRPIGQLIKRRRRAPSNDSTTTSDFCRSTPSPTNNWEMESNDSESEWSSPSPSSSSTSESLRSSISYSSTERKIKASKKKSKRTSRRETNSSSKDKKKKKRTSRSRHKSKNKSSTPPLLEKDKPSKRKSYSGKGVKSSKKSESTTVEQNQTALDQPSTSGTSSTHRSKSDKVKKRHRSSRETKRLKSVVNVMYSQKNSGDSNSSVNTNTSNVSSAPAPNSSSESIQGDERVRRVYDTSSSTQGSSRSSAAPRAAADTDTSDPEDDLPLNLTVQKTYTSL